MNRATPQITKQCKHFIFSMNFKLRSFKKTNFILLDNLSFPKVSLELYNKSLHTKLSQNF